MERKQSSEQFFNFLFSRAFNALNLGLMNDSGIYFTYDGKEVRITKDMDKKIFSIYIGDKEKPYIAGNKKDGFFNIYLNINDEIHPLHPLHLKTLENVDAFFAEAGKSIEQLEHYIDIGLLKASDKKLNYSINFDNFYNNLPYSSSRRKRAVIVPAINRLFNMTDEAELENADYILFSHPWGAVADKSEDCISQLKHIDMHRKNGAVILAVGSATNAQSQIGSSIKNIIYMEGNYVEQLGKMFDVQLEEKPIHYNLKTGVLELFPATGCLRNCAFCWSSHKKRDFRSVHLEEIKKKLDKFKSEFPEALNTIEFFAENLAEYGIDLTKKQEFPELLKLVASYPEVKEIRLPYGLTISEMKPQLLGAILENKTKITRIGLHFETGSDRLLTLVKKGHTKERAIELMNTIRQEMPSVIMLSALIIGLPTETFEDVDESVDLIKRTQIDGIICNLFRYSPYAKAAALPQVSGNQKLRHFEYLISELEKANLSYPLQIQYQGPPLRNGAVKLKEFPNSTAYNFGNPGSQSRYIPK